MTENIIICFVVLILIMLVGIMSIVILFYKKNKTEGYLSPNNSKVKEINKRLIKNANKIMKDLYEHPYIESDRKYILNIMKNFNIDKLKPYKLSNKVGETINKGNETYMCYRDKNGFIPDHILYIVLLHEMAHMGLRKSIQHPPQFWNLMGKLVARALELGIINIDDYPEETVSRCGAPIISSGSIYDLIGNINNEIIEEI